MSADRERIKRAISYGDCGENSLDRNAFVITTYICVDGKKYTVSKMNDYYVAYVPGRVIAGPTIEALREELVDALAFQARAGETVGCI